ncbi:MAG: exodeoxyribonuclease VII large subunit [Pseudomonadota bacterium]
MANQNTYLHRFTVVEMIMLLTEQKNPILSVTELAKRIQATVSTQFMSVCVKGEISGYTKHSSGHQYFTIKDEGALLDAICWRGTMLSTPLQEGAEIIAYGRITTYPLRSKYQIVVEQVEASGVGALQKMLKERYEAFKKKGYFDDHHKKQLPAYPLTIGVISSPTGAVIQDILHRIRDRFPCHVILWPVSVQGEGAEKEIVRAIKGFHAHIKPDVLIVARGGGSLEDLWVFNDESIIQAIYNATIPIVSAIGHETDVTLIDYVADMRAPTPTGAAELCVPVRQAVLMNLKSLGHAIEAKALQKIQWLLDIVMRMRIPTPTQMLEYKTQYLDDMAIYLDGKMQNIILFHNNRLNRIMLVSPDLGHLDQRLQMLWQSLSFGMKRYLDQRIHRMSDYQTMLSNLDIPTTLKRGFCIPRLKGHVLTLENAKQVTEFELQFHEGTLPVSIPK